MANPTTVGVDDNNPAVLKVTTTVFTVTLEPQREYMLVHNGLNVGGTADTGTIFFGIAANPAVDYDEGADLGQLNAGAGKSPIVIGPGLKEIRLDTDGTGPTCTIIPGRFHVHT